MQTAYIINGQLVDKTTIKLSEPVPFEDGAVKVVIEQQSAPGKTRKDLYGILKGSIIMSDDFDEPLDCFKEYIK